MIINQSFLWVGVGGCIKTGGWLSLYGGGKFSAKKYGFKWHLVVIKLDYSIRRQFILKITIFHLCSAEFQ